MRRKSQSRPSHHDLMRAHALLQTVAVHHVPVNVLARIMGLGRQTVYRQLQQARIELRRAAEAARKARQEKFLFLNDEEFLVAEEAETDEQ